MNFRCAAHSYLVHHDVVGVDVELGELLHQALGLVERQKLGDAHAHEGGLGRVLESQMHALNHLLWCVKEGNRRHRGTREENITQAKKYMMHLH